MEGREARGVAIAKAGMLRQKGSLWIVRSQTGFGTHVVEPNGPTPNCSCLDFETTQKKCKHLWAVECAQRGDFAREDEEPPPRRLTYPQEWAAYNKAQVHEKERLAVLLHSLCSAIDNPVHTNGRPRLPLADMIFSAVMKVYGGTSSRRAQTDLRDFAAKGYIDKAPHYNSVLNILEDRSTTAVLQALIAETAKPLRAFETDFAADSSGFSTCVYERWFDHKYGHERSRSQWVKAHVMTGTHTNVVTAVEVTDSYTSDASMFEDLLDRTAENFRMVRVSADKAYSTHTNLSAVEYHGAQPFIPFKQNARSHGLDIWGRLLRFFVENRHEFELHYHKRSNVETTFHMIKAKFGARVRAKTPVAQVNEVLAKVLCHNLCCLVSAFYELGVEATFWHAVA